MWNTEERINTTFVDYFSNLFSSNVNRDGEEILQHTRPIVTEEMNKALIKPFTEEELLKALQQMDREKAPGPDGLNPGFFKDHWSSVGKGVLKFAQSFFEYHEINPDSNHTHICLIPKIESPTSPKDFRPISLCNVAYKLISKVLADRLKPWLKFIISDNQTAFVPDRLITNNILIAHELLHSLNTKKSFTTIHGSKAGH